MEVIKQKYKQTEVGIIPIDWKSVSFTECADIKHGFQFREEHFTNRGIKIIKIGNLKYSGELDLDKITYTSFENLSKFSNFLLKKGDVLMALTGATLGKSSIVKTNEPLLQNYRVGNFLNKSNVSKEFLYYIVQSDFIQKNINKLVNEAAQPNLGKQDFHNFIFPLPPTLKEQTAIATALSDTDAWINSLEQLLTKKRQIKQGAMQELLQPKKGWEVSTIKQVANFRRGSFPQPYGLDKWYDDYNGMPFVQVYDVDDNKKLKVDTKRKISIAGSKFSVFVEKGSVIITIQGSIGRIAITQYDAYVDRTLLIFESFNVKFDKYFFVTMIELLFEKEKEKAPGGIIKTITKEALSSFEITYPDFEEQTRIATILSDMDEEIGQLESKLEKAKQLKQGMMQELLTGRIRLV